MRGWGHTIPANVFDATVVGKIIIYQCFITSKIRCAAQGLVKTKVSNGFAAHFINRLFFHNITAHHSLDHAYSRSYTLLEGQLRAGV